MKVSPIRSLQAAARRSCVCSPSYLAPGLVGTTNGVSPRRFSVLNRPPPNYEGHVPLTTLERAGLAVGSGLWSLLDPRRGDLIAAFAEATATPYFVPRLRDAMLGDPTGRRILRDRPRMTSTSLDLPHLRSLPANTLGRTYVEWLDREKVTPDTRAAVRYVDDEECAYVLQRYRESHDFYHALTGLPTMREGEVALKTFEFANTLLPMTGLASFAAFTLKRGERRRFWNIYLPWAVTNGLRAKEVINVYWEEQMERDVADLRRELNIQPPPDMRDMRRREREEKRRRKEAATAAAAAATAAVRASSTPPPPPPPPSASASPSSASSEPGNATPPAAAPGT